MLISKRSRRSKGAFVSRFEKGSSEFPLRQYLACREELAGLVVQIVLLLAFAGVVIGFSFTLHRVFQVHGAHLSVGYEALAQLGVGGMLLLVVRRVFSRIGALRDLREEMSGYKSQLPERPR